MQLSRFAVANIRQAFREDVRFLITEGYLQDWPVPPRRVRRIFAVSQRTPLPAGSRNAIISYLLEGRQQARIARDVGVSRSYVSQINKKLRGGL